MGKSKKNRNSKRKHNEKPDSGESKTSAPSTSNTTEVDFDRKAATECTLISNEKIMRSGIYLQILLEWKRANEIGKRSEYIATICSQSTKSDIDEMIIALLEAVWLNKCVIGLISKIMTRYLTPHQGNLNSVVHSQRDLYEYAKLHSPKLIEIIEDSLIIRDQKKHLLRLTKIIFQGKRSGRLTIEAKSETFRILLALRFLRMLEKDSDLQDTTATTNVEGEVNKIVTYFVKKKKNVLTNDGDIPNHDIKKITHSTQKSTNENKGETGCSSKVLKADKSNYTIELEYDDEANTKTIGDIEIMAKAEEVPEMRQMDKLVNVCTKTNKDDKNISKNLQFLLEDFMKFLSSGNAKNSRSLKPLLIRLTKQFIALLKKEKENDKSVYDINVTRQLEKKLNDIIIELENAEGIEKGKDVDASEYNQVAGKSPQIIMENKKKGQNGNEDTETTNCNIQYVRSNKETMKLVHGIENCITIENDIPEERHSNKEDKIISPVKAKIKLPCSIKEYLTLQKTKFFEQAKKYGDILSTLKPFKQQQDSFPSEKGLRTARMSESYSENKSKTDVKDEAIKEVMSTELEYSNQIIVETNEYKFIKFKFDTYRNKFIYTLDNKSCFTMEEKQPLTFRFRNEGIQVCFTGENIFVSTKNNEFDIYIRKFTPINLTDEATQTHK